MAIARRRELSDERTNVSLIGTKDAVNKTFMTPEKFFRNTNRSIKVYVNGQRLYENVDGIGDYLPAESGGAGTGYDTIIFNASVPAPRASDILIADYFIA